MHRVDPQTVSLQGLHREYGTQIILFKIASLCRGFSPVIFRSILGNFDKIVYKLHPTVKYNHAHAHTIGCVEFSAVKEHEEAVEPQCCRATEHQHCSSVFLWNSEVHIHFQRYTYPPAVTAGLQRECQQ